MTKHTLLAIAICFIASLPAPLASAEDETAGARHHGAIVAYPQPLCGASHQTGIYWAAAANSIGAAYWRVVVTYEHLTTGGTYGTTTEVTYLNSNTASPRTFQGGACGSWVWCNARASIQWYDGANWIEEHPSVATPCIRLP